MDAPTLPAVLFLTLLGTLGLLIAILAWIGSRVHDKIDNLTDKMDSGLKEMNVTLSSIEKDLRGELVKLDRRLTKMEDTYPPFKSPVYNETNHD